MRTALLLSPHLDDVAFSCGGTAARLVRQGWRVVVATVFTRSVHPATGFALECQRDKGLPDDLDYMALRRAEDATASAELGAELRHLDLPEAPHRGYASAAALFGARHDADAVAPVSAVLAELLASERPALVLAPQGCGGHVDHLLLIDAVRATVARAVLGFYRDTPYVIRNPAAAAHVDAPLSVRVAIAPADLERKQRAACAYRSQLRFQFGGTGEASAALRDLASREADGAGFAECFRADSPAFGELLDA